MKKINVLLIFLISSIGITGFSFVDGKIWNIVFLIVGMVAYAIVGLFYSIGILRSKSSGREAYAFVFFLLLLTGYGVYQVLVKLRYWILTLPITIKIIVLTFIVLIIVLTVTVLVLSKKKGRNDAD